MPFTVQYGPISGALQLAQTAGAGQGFNIQSQRDLQALQLQNQMQQTANQYAESTAQQAMARQELAARLQAQTSNQQQEAAYRAAQQQLAQQQLAQQNRQFQQEQGIKQQQLGQTQSQINAAAKDREQQVQNLASYRDSLVKQNTAAEAERQRVNRINALKGKAAMLKDQMTLLSPQMDPLKQPDDAKRSDAESQFNASMKAYQQTIDNIDAATGAGAVAAPPQTAPAASLAPQVPPDVWAQAEDAVGPDPKKQAAWVAHNWTMLMKQRAAKAASTPAATIAPAPVSNANTATFEHGYDPAEYIRRLLP